VTAKKPAERRQSAKTRRGTHTPDATLVLLPPSVPLVPAAQPHWRDPVVEAWQDLWLSPLAGPKFLTVTDRPALVRLFEFRNRLLAAIEAFEVEPIVAGSTGQATLSPWALEVARLEAAVARLEAQFGLTPLARLKLGISFEEGINLAARNAQLLAAFRASQVDPDGDVS
jgi:P27 family predicted phage terminase small subunit